MCDCSLMELLPSRKVTSRLQERSSLCLLGISAMIGTKNICLWVTCQLVDKRWIKLSTKLVHIHLLYASQNQNDRMKNYFVSASGAIWLLSLNSSEWNTVDSVLVSRWSYWTLCENLVTERCVCNGSRWVCVDPGNRTKYRQNAV